MINKKSIAHIKSVLGGMCRIYEKELRTYFRKEKAVVVMVELQAIENATFSYFLTVYRPNTAIFTVINNTFNSN